MKTAVSIIIPTYNRAGILGQTLDSILGQTYKEWECLVIDDGSMDHTNELMDFYCEKDARIEFHSRPGNRRKGANACRNYGFELSKGKYIQWFDSDDLMVPVFLEKKVAAIERANVDFIISKTANFLDPDPQEIIDKNERYYRFEKYEITHANYVTQKINWLTPDFLGKRKAIAEIRFNERLRSAQERNFFTKLSHHTVNGVVINEFLTKRRMHSASIRAFIGGEEKIEELESRAFTLETWNEIAKLDPGSESEKYFLFRLLELNSRRTPDPEVMLYLLINFFRQKRFATGLSMVLYKYFYKHTGRGETLRRTFMKCLNQKR